MKYLKENKICQSCKKDFTIESEDFNFYEKIKVPPPTFCPECRMIRRMIWRNEHSLFRRPNDAPGKSESIISIYHPEQNLKVYDRETWWGDSWDPCSYEMDYDFLKSFFEQFKNLMKNVPQVAFIDSKSINCRFCNVAVEFKNCYMANAGVANEDSVYSNRISKCKFIHDSYTCFTIEFGYEDVSCKESSKLFFSRESEACLDSYFLYDCRNCVNCILCSNLRNKSYCIENIQYTKEEYFKKKQELELHTRKGIKKAGAIFQELWKKAFHKHLKLTNTTNVLGDHVANSRNCQEVFDIEGDAESVKHSHWGVSGLKDSYDLGPGCGDAELMYESASVGVGNNRIFFSACVLSSRDIFYSYLLNNCSDCFGCVGLNKKQYCIFNKQYTKEAYKEMVSRIIEQMKKVPYVDKVGKVYSFGEFFPSDLSPFAYNETVAQDYYPIDKEKAKADGFLWREYNPNLYETTIKGKDLPQTIAEVDNFILNEIIECEVTGKPFRIIEQELSFYRRFNLPLPSLHPDERHRRRLLQRNPMILRKQMCYFGDKEVVTTYLPEEKGGPEKVICTEHYNKEIY